MMAISGSTNVGRLGRAYAGTRPGMQPWWRSATRARSHGPVLDRDALTAPRRGGGRPGRQPAASTLTSTKHPPSAASGTRRTIDTVPCLISTALPGHSGTALRNTGCHLPREGANESW